MTAEVRAVRFHGTVAVLYVVNRRGVELAIAVDARMARALDSALALGERPVVEYAPWQVLYGTEPGDPRLPRVVVR